MIVFRTFKGDERGGKFHLRIGCAQADRLLHVAIAIEGPGGIWLVIADPLFIGLGKLSKVEPSQGVRVACGRGINCSQVQPCEQFFRHLRIVPGE